MPAQRQVRFGSRLGRHQRQLVQMRAIGVGEAGVGELGQRFAAPQPKRVSEHPRRLEQLAVGAQAAPFRDQVLESGRVHVTGADIERVTGVGGDDGGRSEGSAQLDDLGLQGVGRLGRCPSPQSWSISRSALTGRPRLSARRASRARCLVPRTRTVVARLHHLELAEEPHLHVPTLRPMAGGCRTLTWPPTSGLRQWHLRARAQAAPRPDRRGKEAP